MVVYPMALVQLDVVACEGTTVNNGDEKPLTAASFGMFR